jgi:hypothetical protein
MKRYKKSKSSYPQRWTTTFERAKGQKRRKNEHFPNVETSSDSTQEMSRSSSSSIDSDIVADYIQHLNDESDSDNNEELLKSLHQLTENEYEIALKSYDESVLEIHTEMYEDEDEDEDECKEGVDSESENENSNIYRVDSDNDNDHENEKRCYEEREEGATAAVIASYPLEIRTRESATTHDLLQYVHETQLQALTPLQNRLQTRREKKRLKKLENRRLKNRRFYPTATESPCTPIRGKSTTFKSFSEPPKSKKSQQRTRRNSLENCVSRLKLTESSTTSPETYPNSVSSHRLASKYHKYLHRQTFVRAVNPNNSVLFISDLETPTASHLLGPPSSSLTHSHRTDSNVNVHSNNNTHDSIDVHNPFKGNSDDEKQNNVRAETGKSSQKERKTSKFRIWSPSNEMRSETSLSKSYASDVEDSRRKRSTLQRVSSLPLLFNFNNVERVVVTSLPRNVPYLSDNRVDNDNGESNDCGGNRQPFVDSLKKTANDFDLESSGGHLDDEKSITEINDSGREVREMSLRSPFNTATKPMEGTVVDEKAKLGVSLRPRSTNTTLRCRLFFDSRTSRWSIVDISTGFKERLQRTQRNHKENSKNIHLKEKKLKIRSRKRSFDRSEILEFNTIFREFVADEQSQMYVTSSLLDYLSNCVVAHLSCGQHFLSLLFAANISPKSTNYKFHNSINWQNFTACEHNRRCQANDDVLS